MKRVALVSIWALLCMFASSARGETSAEYRDAVQRLMDVTGAAQIGTQVSAAVVAQMSQSMRAARPDMPPRAFDLVEDVTNEVIQQEFPSLVDDLVDLYARHLTLAEIQEISAFYETPVGRKVITVMPRLMADVIEMSQAWAIEIQPLLRARMMERLQQEGLALAQVQHRLLGATDDTLRAMANLGEQPESPPPVRADAPRVDISWVHGLRVGGLTLLLDHAPREEDLAEITAAAPDMSIFISSIAAEGLSE